MKQESQTKLAFGIGAITLAVVAGYFGLDYLSEKKAASPTAATSGDYSAVIATATENAGAAGGGTLTADQARRIGEEVARQVATQVAQSIVDQKSGGASAAGGLSEADARRIGEEEGRRVAQEVATATVQQMMAASGGSGSAGGLTAAEAEQIGDAAGRRAAKQVAASTAREIVRTEFGGGVAAKTDAAVPTQNTAVESNNGASNVATVATTQKAGAGSDALHAWWSTPASGDFGLMYAGQPKGESAIALLFSEKPSDSALSQNVKVYDAKGTLVSGSWEAAANPNLAVLRGLQPGRYTVVVEPALADASGKAVNKGQHGPVYVI